MKKQIKNRLCVIHNNLCEASGQLEKDEQKLVACLVSLIEKDDEDFKSYILSVTDIAKFLEVADSNLYRAIRPTIAKLKCKSLALRPADGSKGEIIVDWFASSRYRENQGLIEFTIAPALKPYLLQLKKHFTKFYLSDVVTFRSRFSMPIYLMLKQYLAIGKRKFTLEDFRGALRIEGQYEQYGILRLRVVEQAVKEINQKTSLNVTYEEIKEGRKVVGIIFSMTSKPIIPQEVDLFLQPEQPPKAPPQPEKKKKPVRDVPPEFKAMVTKLGNLKSI